jgi:hypothetical protein
MRQRREHQIKIIIQTNGRKLRRLGEGVPDFLQVGCQRCLEVGEWGRTYVVADYEEEEGTVF